MINTSHPSIISLITFRQLLESLSQEKKNNKLTSICLTIRGNESFIKISDILQKCLKVYRLQSIRSTLRIETNFQVKGEIKHEKRSKVIMSVQGKGLLFLSFLEGKQR
jgi:hypothetical protein